MIKLNAVDTREFTRLSDQVNAAHESEICLGTIRIVFDGSGAVQIGAMCEPGGERGKAVLGHSFVEHAETTVLERVYIQRDLGAENTPQV